MCANLHNRCRCHCHCFSTETKGGSYILGPGSWRSHGQSGPARTTGIPRPPPPTPGIPPPPSPPNLCPAMNGAGGRCIPVALGTSAHWSTTTPVHWFSHPPFISAENFYLFLYCRYHQRDPKTPKSAQPHLSGSKFHRSSIPQFAPSQRGNDQPYRNKHRSKCVPSHLG